MPEFEMPAEVGAPPPIAQRAAPTTVRPAHTADMHASDTLDAPRRSRPRWRQLLIAGVIGAIIGAAIPGGIQLAERGAASADQDALRAAAMDYLTAIAQGRAADASAMVPLPTAADEIPDALLQAAEGITEFETRLVRIDGDIGTVDVVFHVGAIEVQHTLGADRVAGDWWLTTSLAESVEPMYWGGAVEVSIGGVALDLGRGLHLYPGLYQLDAIESGVIDFRSERFAVDGDGRSMTEMIVHAEVEERVGTRAMELGRLIVLECQATQECAAPADEELDAMNAYVREAGSDFVDLATNFAAEHGNGPWYEVLVRIVTDERGEPAEWLCGGVGDFGVPTEPCPEPA